MFIKINLLVLLTIIPFLPMKKSETLLFLISFQHETINLLLLFLFQMPTLFTEGHKLQSAAFVLNAVVTMVNFCNFLGNSALRKSGYILVSLIWQLHS